MRAFSVSVVTLSALLGESYAWGSLGHRTVAKVAYKLLTPETQQYIDGILAYKDDRDISDGAVWPDQIKHFRPETSSWHYIDARDSPPTQCVLNYPDDCDANSKNGCIISAIVNQTALFIDPNTSGLIRQEALKFVVHFIGDLHQPLHTENLERGGNGIPVCWHNACARTNLHSVWDTLIPMAAAGIRGHPNLKQERINAARWADELVPGNYSAGAASLLAGECADVDRAVDCSMEWAREVNAFNCKYVFQPSPEALEHQDLSTAYYEGAKPIVEYLVGKGGVRLAAWLEAMVRRSNEVRGISEQVVLGNFELK